MALFSRMCAAVVVSAAVVAPVALHAEEYATDNLGAAPLSYIEHRFDINEDGRAVWTGLVGGDEHAMYSDVGGGTVDLHATVGAFGHAESRAQSINESGDIVGFVRTNSQEIFREAMLWLNASSTPGTGSSTLHAGLPAGTQISAAYDIAGVSGHSDSYVVGYYRSTFQEPSTPVLWRISNTGSVVSAQGITLSAGMDYGIAYGVAPDGSVVGGEGIYGSTAMYAFYSTGAGGSAFPVPGVQASDGYATSVASSIDGDIVTGYALHATSGRATAFVWEIGEPTAEVDLKIGPNGGTVGAQSLGYGARETADGPIVYGLSLIDGQNSSMSGMLYRSWGDNPQECNINDSMTEPAVPTDYVTHVFDVNSSGQGVGLISTNSGVQAVMLEEAAERDVAATLYRRVPNAATTPSIGEHYWAELEAMVGTPLGGTVGTVVFSNAPGCGISYNGVDACDGTSDLSDEGVDGTDFLRLGDGEFGDGSLLDTEADVPRVMGAAPEFDYAQVITNDRYGCRMSGVAEPTWTINPAGEDVWGGDWGDCVADNLADLSTVGAETDLHTSLENCGACGVDVEDTGASCTTDTCNMGNVVNSINAGSCRISGTCYVDDDENALNECLICDSDADNDSWSFAPDAWECDTDGLSCTSQTCGNGTGSCDDTTINNGTCLIGGDCFSEDEERSGNECQACQAGTSQTSWTNDPNGTSCTDTSNPGPHPVDCTVAGCSGGSCSQTYDIASNTCFIAGGCYANNQERPGNQCQACRPGSRQDNWTNDTNGTGCSTDVCYTQTCQNGSCNAGTPIVDSYENDDTWQTRTHLGSWEEDHYFGNSGRWGENPTHYNTIFPENDDDWYSFYVDDDFQNCIWQDFTGGSNRGCYDSGATNDNPQGMVELQVPAGSDYDVCVYVECNRTGRTPNSISWYGNGTYSSSYYINGDTLAGRCAINPGNTTEVLEFHPDCPSVNDSVRAYVRVYDFTNNARCEQDYRLRVGNHHD